MLFAFSILLGIVGFIEMCADTLWCSYCDLQFVTMESLQQHRFHCSESFGGYNDFPSVIYPGHSNEDFFMGRSQSSGNIMKYRCDKCSKLFKFKHNKKIPAMIEVI